LFNAGGKSVKARLDWAKPESETVLLSNLAEESISEITKPINMAAYEIVTLRVPLPGM
jgi:hypothetical protein